MLQWVDLSPILGLVPVAVVRGWIWQPATYMFLHSPVCTPHPVQLADDVDDRQRSRAAWGGTKYLTYWLICGIGAGICVTARRRLPRRDDPDDRSIGRDLRIVAGLRDDFRGAAASFHVLVPDQSANDGVDPVRNCVHFELQSAKRRGFPRGPSRRECWSDGSISNARGASPSCGVSWSGASAGGDSR